MKVLSIRQPWAWAIVRGWKTVENRNWRTDHRGPLAIHAPLAEDDEDLPRVLDLVDRTNYLRGHARVYPSVLQQLYRDTRGPLGHVVGVVHLSGVVTGHDPDHKGRAWAGNLWFRGPWGFTLHNARPVRPVPLRGRLGLFEADLDLERLEAAS